MQTVFTVLWFICYFRHPVKRLNVQLVFFFIINSVINSWAAHNNIEKEQQKTFINTTLQNTNDLLLSINLVSPSNPKTDTIIYLFTLINMIWNA